jgi:hypothetical protein
MKITHHASINEPTIPHKHFILVEHIEESIYIILRKMTIYQLERVRDQRLQSPLVTITLYILWMTHPVPLKRHSPDADFWKEAIKSEMDYIMSNATWEVVEHPYGCKPIGSKWVSKKNLRPDGNIERYKARLVIKGYSQKEGEDFFNTYSHVARLTTIRVLLSLAASHGLLIHQMDIKTTFLNGELDEEIYMEHLAGFVANGQEGMVCKLLKSLYGLKQAHKQWHKKLDRTLTSVGFIVNEADKCVYYRYGRGERVIFCLYVDDILILETSLDVIKDTKEFISNNFEMKDLGEADVILNIKLLREGNCGITLLPNVNLLQRLMILVCY